MPFVGILGLAFQKTIVIFEMSTLKFVSLQYFAQKQKCPYFEPKMRYFGILGLQF